MSLATDGNTLVVGAQFADARGDDSGVTYVFERKGDGWHPGHHVIGKRRQCR